MVVGNSEKRKPVLLLEINEIPWRLIDLYSDSRRYPHISSFIAGSRTYTTVSVDTGHLSPWVTWPSLHRGLPDHIHGIRNLGQDPATFKGTPIWEEFRSLGESIGIFGSLQSWPPIDPGDKGFYVPDTFAHDEKCFPAYLEPFQKFNLNQVKKNGRVLAGNSMLSKESAMLTLSLPRLGIRPGTLAGILEQFAREKLNKAHIARRPVFQTMLFWDIFKSVFRPDSPPAFSTFFTNHVAGLMHRYWHHMFPDDFGKLYRDSSRWHRATMDFGWRLVDKILGDAIAMRRKNPDLVVAIASSMGQAAVFHPEHEGFAASVPDIGVLMSAFGLSDSTYKRLMAMVPHVAVEIEDAGVRAAFVSALGRSRLHGGRKPFKVQEIGNSVSILVGTPKKEDFKAGGFFLAEIEGDTHSFTSWEKAGIRMNEVEAGTGYHIPQGIFARYLGEGQGADLRTEIPSDQVKSMLMEWSGLWQNRVSDREILQKA